MRLQLHAVEIAALLREQQPLPLPQTDPAFGCEVHMPVRASLSL